MGFLLVDIVLDMHYTLGVLLQDLPVKENCFRQESPVEHSEPASMNQILGLAFGGISQSTGDFLLFNTLKVGVYPDSKLFHIQLSQ